MIIFNQRYILLLGSTFSKFFGGDGDKPVTESPDEGTPDEKPVEEKPDEEKPTDKKSEEAKPNKTSESDKKTNETSKNGTESETKEVKPKVLTIKEPIAAEENILSISALNKKQFSASSKKLQKFNNIEKELNRRATALNNLESFVIDIQNKLYEDEYTQASTEEEIEKIKSACSEISDWLYEDGAEADADTYEKKLDELHSLTRELFARVWEHKERPEALKALHQMLNHSSHFLENAKNLTKTTNPEKDVFTDVEVETLGKLIAETTEWRDKIVKEQKTTKKNDAVKLTVKMLMDKMAALDREVKYLVNKIKMWRPKKVEKPVSEKGDGNATEKSETPNEEEEKIIPVEEIGTEEATIEEPVTEGQQGESESEKKTGDEGDSHSEL